MKKMNKWFYAFLAVAIVLVVAVATIVMMGLNKDTPDPTPDYTEGAETGVYYYDVADGEVVLSLNSGNIFSIAGPGLNKSGTYTVNGDQITFDFVRDEDGTAPAVLANGNITLTYNEVTMTFIPKVNYTVSFNTNGGSAVNSVSVLNGKLAAKPVDPTKDGHVFIGWYSDSDFKTLYNFATTTVAQDVTVYARWAEVKVGQNEYTADFDLGYAGAPALENLNTVGGKLYGMPDVPSREGYTFGGWFISMYEDGEKLSYAYTEDTVLDANTTLYAVWHENASTKLTVPNVSVSGTTIKWDSVTGANAYKVVIKDANGTIVEPERNVSTTTVNYDFGALPAGDYTVEVVAIANNTANNSDAAVRFYKNKALGRVSKFQVVDGVLLFNAVEGAEKYLITIDCGNDGHKHVLFDNGTSTNYNFANCSMQEGGITFVVTAVASGYASTPSETFVYNRVLASVGSVVYDAEKDAFIWNEVPFAAKYNVTVKVGNTTYTFDNGAKTSFSLAGYTGEVTINVVPVTDGYNSPASVAATCTKVAPPVPTGIIVNGMTLTWNEVEGATSYEVKIGSITKTVTTNSLDLSDSQLGLYVGNTYSVQVKAFKGNESSVYSDAVSVGYRVMSSKLTYSDRTVYWTPVAGVSSFEVRVNGKNPIRVDNANHAVVTLTKSGINTIEVKYLDFGGSSWVSMEVVAYAVTYNTRSLGGEFTEYLVSGDTMTPPTEDVDFTVNGFAFDGWYNSPTAAAGNGKEYTSTVFTGNSDTILYANWSPKSYKVQFQVEGFDISNIPVGTEGEVTYTQDYKLPVPISTNAAYESFFVGWYTGPAGSGDRLTDEKGNSVVAFPFYRDTVAYPYFNTGILSFVMKDDGTYAVKMGPSFTSVSHVTIPHSYDGVPVTSILENAFANSKTLVTIDIPADIRLIGTGAFSGCNVLESINMYPVDGNYETFYTTHDGALLMHDMGTVYLEVFPRAKTGVYTVPEIVDTIRDKAFQYSNIDKVIISKGVTLVKVNAFYNCRRITAVEFEGGRTSLITIEDGAFYKCATIASVKLPANLAQMDYFKVLDTLTGLQTIEVEEGGAYYAAVNGMLTNAIKDTILYVPASVSGVVTIPKGISHVGPYAFSEIKGITKVVIPAYVETIGEGAFLNCAGITEVSVYSGRNIDLTIGEAAFAYCTKLKSVEFGTNDNYEAGKTDKGAISIGADAFAPVLKSVNPEVVYDTALQKLVFTNGVRISSIGARAFANQTSLTRIQGFENASVVIAEIGESAFAGNTMLSNITVPASTKVIGDNAFAGCTAVAKVDFAAGGTGIEFGEGVFADCMLLTEIYLPATLSQFNGTAFAGCPSLQKITVDPTSPYYSNDEKGILYDAKKTEIIFYPKSLPVDQDTLNTLPWDTITKIGDSVFSYNDSLTSFEVKKGVTVIGKAAFADCKNLTTVTFEAGGSALVVDDQAFYNCKKIETIALPAYTTEIGDSAFENAQFTGFVVPEDVVSIGYAAFRNANKLQAVNIPAKVTAIGDAAFANCAALATVTFENGAALTIGSVDVATADEGVFYKTALTALDTKGRAVTIGNYAFYQLKTLASVSFGGGLVTIGNYAFQDASFESVVIPNTVTTIGEHAFGGSTAAVKLSNVTFEKGGTAPLNIGFGAFAYTKIVSVDFPNRIDVIYTTTSINSVELKQFMLLFDGVTTLAEINVEEGSAKYASIDGVLYEKNDRGVISILLFCPSENVGRLDENDQPTYTIYVPNTVELVENGAFANIHKIKTLIFEEFEKNDPNYGKPILRLGNCKSDSEWVDLSADSNTETTATEPFGGIYAVIGGDLTISSKKYTAPSSWKNEKVTNSITTIKLPSHIGYIGAFGITMTKDTLTLTFNPDATDLKIGRNAFYKANVDVYELPVVSHVGTYAFYYTGKFNASTKKTEALSKLTFDADSTLTEISRFAFSGCKMTSFELPASVEVLGEGAFYSCTLLESLIFPEGSNLQEIGVQSFYGCDAMKTIDFTNATKLSYIGNQAFYSAGLTSFTFPESVTSIGSKIFDYCDAIETITLSSKVSAAMVEPTGTNESMFSGMKKLTEIKINGNNPELCVVDGVLYDKAMTVLYCFPQGKDVTGFQIPATITRLGNHAFYLYKASTLVLPEGLEYIGASAFSNSSALTEVHIPASVKEIGQGAFASATSGSLSKIHTVTFGENSQLKKLGQNVFYYSKSLKNIVLPDSVEEIGPAAFYSCTSLKTVILPAALTAIPEKSGTGYGLFQNCSGLTSVVIQSNVESIGENAFKGVTLIQEITIPAATASIGASAFNGITSLKTVTILPGSRLETIGNSAFAACTKLTGIDLPATLKTMGTGVFQGNSAMTSVTMAGALETLPTNTFTGCTSLATVVLPEKLGAIEANAFSSVADRIGTVPGATALQEIVIPATVTSIGKNAFDGCTSLESVVFAEGSVLESLGTDATVSDDIFKDTNLKNVVLPDNLKFIGAYMFANMQIGDVVLPSTMNVVGDYAFYNCDNLTNVALYGNTTYIGEYAFYDCDNLVTAEVSSGLEYFGTLAFGCCDKLAAGFIPDTVVTMNGNPFAGCPLITTFPISEDNDSFYVDTNGVIYDSEDKYTLVSCPSTLTGEFVIDEDTFELAPGAFSNSQITSITIQNKLGKISDLAFMNCTKLETVTIEEGIRGIGNYAFYGCTALTNVNIPTSLKEIGEYAFANCSALAMAVVLPNGVNATTGALPQYLFANSGITSVVIPASITNIEAEGVFSGCSNLASVTFGAETLNCEGIGSYFFKDCTSLTEITIPKGAGDIFKTSGVGVFMGCTALQKVTLTYTEPQSSGLASAPGATAATPTTSDMFNGCTSLTEVIVYNAAWKNKGTSPLRPKWELQAPAASGMNYVGANFFKGCTSLTALKVVTGSTVHDTAFEGCGEVTITKVAASGGSSGGSTGPGRPFL